jgi:hypothetical protein
LWEIWALDQETCTRWAVFTTYYQGLRELNSINMKDTILKGWDQLSTNIVVYFTEEVNMSQRVLSMAHNVHIHREPCNILLIAFNKVPTALNLSPFNISLLARPRLLLPTPPLCTLLLNDFTINNWLPQYLTANDT